MAGLRLIFLNVLASKFGPLSVMTLYAGALFLVLWCILRIWRTYFPIRGARVTESPALFKYEVFSKDERWFALKSGSGFKFLHALTYVVVYGFSFPLLAYLYGWRRCGKLIVIPYGVSVMASVIGPLLYLIISDDHGGNPQPLLALVGFVMGRTAVGFWVGFRSEEWRRENMLRLGWSSVAFCDAVDGKEALKSFRRESPRRGLRQRLAVNWSSLKWR